MQKQVSDFISEYQLQTNAETRYIDLVSEIGELGKEIIKSTNYGQTDVTINASFVDEIGDCIFSLLALCDTLNINAEEALQKSISKYEMRFSKKCEIGSDR